MTEAERKALAKLLKTQREKLGLSARELARQAGVDNATITLLEQSRITHPRVDTLRALAKALEIPLGDLYAVANWLPEDALPSLRPYMRAKFGELSESELAQVEQFVDSLTGGKKTIGPAPGEDE